MNAPPFPPTYHDLHVTTADIPRTAIFDLPFSYRVTCDRIGSWQLLAIGAAINGPHLVAGEFDENGLCLDVGSVVIVDSLRHPTGRRQTQAPADHPKA